MANVNIKFNNKEFLLSCEDGQEEHLEELAYHLNEKFNNLKSNLGNIGENKLLLITSISTMEEYFETKKKIDICVFTITDDRITRKIEEALTKGIHIRIISDNTKSEDRGSDLDRLRGTGIECRFDKTSAHMHHKFAISDNDLLLNGSYTWTRSACTENNENILVSNNAKLVQSFQNEFNRLWDSLS